MSIISAACPAPRIAAATLAPGLRHPPLRCASAAEVVGRNCPIGGAGFHQRAVNIWRLCPPAQSLCMLPDAGESTRRHRGRRLPSGSGRARGPVMNPIFRVDVAEGGRWRGPVPLGAACARCPCSTGRGSAATMVSTCPLSPACRWAGPRSGDAQVRTPRRPAIASCGRILSRTSASSSATCSGGKSSR